MATDGLLQWANSIRLTMATDPGRQLFKAQVQTHGFSFLDDYLDSIISNAKQDTLIDLVKTPGRKRTTARKPKPTSKLKGDLMLLSKDKEQKALPGRTSSSSTVQRSSSAPHFSPDFFEQSTQAEIAGIQVMPNIGLSILSTPTTNASIVVLETHPAPQVEHNELSMIAEDDETAERSRVSLPRQEIQVETEGAASRRTDVPAPVDGQRLEGSPPRNTSRDSHKATEVPLAVLADQIPVASGDRGLDASQDTDEEYSAERDTKPPPTSNGDQERCEIIWERQSAEESILQRAKSLINNDNMEVVDMVVPLRDSDLTPSSPKGVSNPVHFPPLPVSAPLRKSMRATVETSNTVDLGAATPGAAIGGKRTSWLQKARQAKALEIAGKKGTATLASASLSQFSLTSSLAGNTKRKSTEVFNGASDVDEGPLRKVPKTIETNASSSRNVHLALDATTLLDSTAEKFAPALPPEAGHAETGQLGEDGMLDLLKKTVEGLGARTGGTGKSLGISTVTSALAEARAAAEARIAERNLKEETVRMGQDIPVGVNEERSDGLGAQSSVSGKRLTRKVSRGVPDATVPTTATIGMTSKESKAFQPNMTPSAAKTPHGLDRRAGTTTPPSTPPLDREVFILPSGPVFNKPPPVFKAPSTKQPSLDKIYSEVNGVHDRSTPAWMSGTQETSYTTAPTESQNPNLCDEDDSWPIDEKLAEGVHWIYGDPKDDSTTWSSLPSQHNTVNLSDGVTQLDLTQPQAKHDQEATGRSDEVTDAIDDADVECETQGADENDQDEPMPDAVKDTVRLVDPPRSQSQLSHSSSASSQQSQTGFFGQAGKLISSMIGSAQKPKPDVKKVLHKAAVAAKKQQEESDRKAVRLKEMENRRQLAIQRKAEEEKAKLIEKEKKIKEENERRKREREEQTDKRPVKAAANRKEDDTTKKRKIEIEKKAELKNPTNSAKPVMKSALKHPSALNPFAAYNSSFNVGVVPTSDVKTSEAKSTKSTTRLTESSHGKGKMPAKPPAMEEDLPPPSQIVQTQMAARAKAQLQAAKQVDEAPLVPSESIDLPDINSEYSDSEDEDRPLTGTKASPATQSTINPDDIFGAIRPLKMEELFKTRTSRFRARTSSANWAGADRLTAEEEKEYAKRMGFK